MLERLRPEGRSLQIGLFALIAGLAACTGTNDDPVDGAVGSTTATSTAVEDQDALEVQVGDDQETQAAGDSQPATAEDVADAGEAADSGDNGSSGNAENTDENTGDNTDGSEATSPAETAWVVVVAGASDPFDSILTESVDELADLGFEGRISNCDQGAAQAIGMAADTTFTVTAEFESQEAAAQAVDTLAANEIDVVAAEVVVACPE